MQPNDTNRPQGPHDPGRLRILRSPLAKLLGVGTLVLLLLIPIAMLLGLVNERESRYRSVLEELGQLWGREQQISGPILVVPFREWCEDNEGRMRAVTKRATFLPEKLVLQARLDPERRHRGLYEAVVYSLELEVSGHFPEIDFGRWQVPDEDVFWDRAELSIALSDPRGIGSAPSLRWGEESLELRPGSSPLGLFRNGGAALTTRPEVGGEGSTSFSYSLRLNGSGGLGILPTAKETEVEMVSDWPDPSFGGSFLPNQRDVSPEGFAASWQVSYFGTGVPATWRAGDEAELGIDGRLLRSIVGVDLLLPVDRYLKVERVVKYAVLFLGLTFFAFFLFEIFRPVQVHPLQYLMVGGALCLFYLLLLSASEHIPFGWAYALSGGAVVALIAGYARAVLHGGGRALLLGGILTGLYGYLFVLVEAQEYSLLLGSVALFIVLATVMFLTRRVDWYRPEAASRVQPSVPVEEA